MMLMRGLPSIGGAAVTCSVQRRCAGCRRPWTVAAAKPLAALPTYSVGEAGDWCTTVPVLRASNIGEAGDWWTAMVRNCLDHALQRHIAVALVLGHRPFICLSLSLCPSL